MDASISKGPTRSAMSSTELAYAQQVYIYNDDVVSGGTVPPLLLKMFDVAASFTDEVLTSRSSSGLYDGPSSSLTSCDGCRVLRRSGIWLTPCVRCL